MNSLTGGVRAIRIFNLVAVQVEPRFWKSWEVENKLCQERRGELRVFWEMDWPTKRLLRLHYNRQGGLPEGKTLSLRVPRTRSLPTPSFSFFLLDSVQVC